jgi:CheY-like chemotaxis protein
MPEMDGLDATRAIRLLDGMPRLPILAMTANAFEEDREACLKAGMDDFVTKPVDPDDIFTKIYQWLQNSAAAGITSEASQYRSGTPPKDALLAQLKAIPGIEVDTGLNVLRGNVDRLAALLHALIDRQPLAALVLENCRLSGNWDDLSRFAHGLKGAAGTLGAVLVERRAFDLEAAIHANRSEREIERLVAELDLAQVHLANAIRTVPYPCVKSDG